MNPGETSTWDPCLGHIDSLYLRFSAPGLRLPLTRETSHDQQAADNIHPKERWVLRICDPTLPRKHRTGKRLDWSKIVAEC